MQQLAVDFEHAGLAEAADAAAAQIRHLDPGASIASSRLCSGCTCTDFLARARYTSNASPTGGALNCSQWMWLFGQPPARAVSMTRLIMPAGPQT
jgi:hypothetical protein